MNHPIFITGAERSGSTLIARIFNECKVFTGLITSMYESVRMNELNDNFITNNFSNNIFQDVNHLNIPIDWKNQVQSILTKEGYKEGNWMYKSAKLSQLWPIWHFAFPNACWIVVRRKTPDIIQSCIRTGFMKTFKDEENLRLVGVSTEEEGWLWWVHQYEKRFVEMIEAGLNCKQIWPERLVRGDYSQIYETLEWLGLEWDKSIVELIDPAMDTQRKKERS